MLTYLPLTEPRKAIFGLSNFQSSNSQLEALAKLPSEQWQEAWTEITATAPGGRITGKHVKSIVARRLQAASPEQPAPQQPLQTSPSSYEIGQIVLIQCEDSTTNQRCRRYSGC